MQDRLDALTIFVAVAEHQSFAEAARQLSRSPATVKRAWSSARAFLHREMTGGALDSGAMGADSAGI